MQSRLLMVEGKIQIEGEVIHVIVQRCHNLSKLLRGLTVADSDELPVLTLSRADERSAPNPAEDKKSKFRKMGKRISSIREGTSDKKTPFSKPEYHSFKAGINNKTPEVQEPMQRLKYYWSIFRIVVLR